MATAILDLTRRVDLIAQAWRRLRPLKTYSSLSVEDFVEGAKPSIDVRAVLKELDGHTKATQKRRKLVDANTEALIRRVVHAVQGDQEDGENSEIYAAMGFVPRSQRARRVRRRATGVVKAPAAASAPTPAPTPPTSPGTAS